MERSRDRERERDRERVRERDRESETERVGTRGLCCSFDSRAARRAEKSLTNLRATKKTASETKSSMGAWLRRNAEKTHVAYVPVLRTWSNAHCAMMPSGYMVRPTTSSATRECFCRYRSANICARGATINCFTKKHQSLYTIRTDRLL
jgi:hypothetical protein